MLNLVKNESVKLLKRPSTYIMIALIVVGTILFGFLTQWLHSNSKNESNNDWKQGLQQDIELYEQEYENTNEEWYKNWMESQIAINQYRIENDIPPSYVDYSMWSFIDESSLMITFVGLFVIIIASGIVANEYSRGTIKMLLVKPYKRWKILLSKYITVILSLLFLLAILFITAAITGALFFGLGDTSAVYLTYENGQVIEQSLLLYLIKLYVLSSVSTLLLATMAFMISAVFRTSGLAVGISIFLLLVGPIVTSNLANHFEWTKYTLFANTDLMQYLEGTVLIDGMTLEFSLVILAIHLILFLAISFYLFNNRDVSA
ncbi:ABC transporter permease [Pallidibacillus thermolactis]|jgi:ABC-2 type transport system permease protein|uniref:ABC transporter permease n=1 Tax=Pallidibacillus thermolactis TaxID=251051 RepID=UPI0021D9F6B8|nr:ABC transporter permease [Pallidibacillus thermolactis]MCU9601327.1 ABC transporter permease [Pallidibacillus thermolactis subsp. kokeshiiformis]